MRLDADEARRRLAAADHGVLATAHPDRGVDAVPVCFAVDGRRLAVPVDEVKPKSSTTLQREANLEHDPRATLLVERWDPHDWSRLWWARAQLVHVRTTRGDVAGPGTGTGTDAVLARLLRAKYPPYAGTTFAALVVFDVVATTGWAAREVPDRGEQG